MALIDWFFRRAVTRGELVFTDHRGRTRQFGSPDAELGRVHIRFADAGVVRSIIADPALGAAEAFMDGRLVIEEGDILALLQLFKANSRFEAGRSRIKPSLPRRAVKAAAKPLVQLNRAARSRRNVAHHYDLSATLYDLFLDADRQYSCAYYTDPDNTLEQAQADKKAHLVAKLAIRPGMRVLDIGCGWGGLALYIHAKTGAEVLGITLSREQLAIARARAAAAGVADKVRFELIDYRALTGTFDRIVSVGMFEHVGTPNYRTFFAKCRELLTPDGVFLLHTIGRAGRPGTTDAFTAKYIFPGGYIPALSEIVEGYEGLRWFASDIETLRLHYAWTLKAWYDRAVAAKAEIVALYDERFFRMWTFYLAGSFVAFRWGGLVNYQLQFTRDRFALPVTRDYMGEEERRLRG